MPITADISRATPGLRLLQGLPAVAVLVSIVHYVDNFANYADYPEPTSGPAPSRGLIAASWFLSGHYTVPGATGMPWWRQSHIVADIACGIAILVFAVWAVRFRTTRPASGTRLAR